MNIEKLIHLTNVEPTPQEVKKTKRMKVFERNVQNIDGLECLRCHSIRLIVEKEDFYNEKGEINFGKCQKCDCKDPLTWICKKCQKRLSQDVLFNHHCSVTVESKRTKDQLQRSKTITQLESKETENQPQKIVLERISTNPQPVVHIPKDERQKVPNNKEKERFIREYQQQQIDNKIKDLINQIHEKRQRVMISHVTTKPKVAIWKNPKKIETKPLSVSVQTDFINPILIPFRNPLISQRNALVMQNSKPIPKPTGTSIPVKFVQMVYK